MTGRTAYGGTRSQPLDRKTGGLASEPQCLLLSPVQSRVTGESHSFRRVRKICEKRPNSFVI